MEGVAVDHGHAAQDLGGQIDHGLALGGLCHGRIAHGGLRDEVMDDDTLVATNAAEGHKASAYVLQGGTHGGKPLGGDTQHAIGSTVCA